MATKKSILYVGHAYYNHYYLAGELRKLGWKADVINIDLSESNRNYYHGEHYRASPTSIVGIFKNLLFFLKSLFKYNIFHFGNADNLLFPPFNQIPGLHRLFGLGIEIRLLKLLGKKIFHSTNGCRDGVTQTTFNNAGPFRVCDKHCVWKNNAAVCSDAKNAAWGELRNKYSDFVGLFMSNRADYNLADICHEAPWIYCLDKDFWDPAQPIPSRFKLEKPPGRIWLFHAVGNFKTRAHGPNNKTIKSTEVWVEVVDRLKSEGYDVEFIFLTDIPGTEIKYYQMQADIILEGLVFGTFGATVREAMMVGKPAISFLRADWLDDMAVEYPEYVEELPVLSATEDTAYATVKWLIDNPRERENIGAAMLDFGLKWHASDSAAKIADKIYESYL